MAMTSKSKAAKYSTEKVTIVVFVSIVLSLFVLAAGALKMICTQYEQALGSFGVMSHFLITKVDVLRKATVLKSLITTYQGKWLDEVPRENDLAFQVIPLKVGQIVDSAVESVELDIIELGNLKCSIYEALDRYNPRVSKDFRERLQKTICRVYGDMVFTQSSSIPSYVDLLNSVPEDIRQIATAIWSWANSRQDIHCN
ncbi:hypothetical protein EYR41_003098 [Orbilia oligospora]|uniref:Uncharacterized protein n=1 Tax=Orbilia oligospora TaxID=2813651 RepID=A0A7C8PTV4_ORBOL|nr:hypothetical protein TWF751_000313 [Orbilia oligospora]TGJ71106.1 hypothetical protein EYR41_003098 [Orbilia oligospora]